MASASPTARSALRRDPPPPRTRARRRRRGGGASGAAPATSPSSARSARQLAHDGLLLRNLRRRARRGAEVLLRGRPPRPGARRRSRSSSRGRRPPWNARAWGRPGPRRRRPSAPRPRARRRGGASSKRRRRQKADGGFPGGGACRFRPTSAAPRRRGLHPRLPSIRDTVDADLALEGRADDGRACFADPRATSTSFGAAGRGATSRMSMNTSFFLPSTATSLAHSPSASRASAFVSEDDASVSAATLRIPSGAARGSGSAAASRGFAPRRSTTSSLGWSRIALANLAAAFSSRSQPRMPRNSSVASCRSASQRLFAAASESAAFSERSTRATPVTPERLASGGELLSREDAFRARRTRAGCWPTRRWRIGSPAP